MDRGDHLEWVLRRTSLLLTVISTLFLLYLFLFILPRSSCGHYRQPYGGDQKQNKQNPLSFPRSSCDVAASRRSLPPDRRFLKLRTSPSWRRRTRAFSSLFLSLPITSMRHQRVLCISASPGHAVDALHLSGVSDVTAVDIFDFPPLIHRADPHNLPFFDGVFDLGFTTGLHVALFPRRFAGEMERTVTNGGLCVVVVGKEIPIDLEEVKGLFRWSTPLGVWNRTLDGSEVAVVVMRRRTRMRNGSSS